MILNIELIIELLFLEKLNKKTNFPRKNDILIKKKSIPQKDKETFKKKKLRKSQNCQNFDRSSSTCQQVVEQNFGRTHSHEKNL